MARVIERIRYPERPAYVPSLARFPAIEEHWKFSRELLSRMQRAIAKKIDNRQISIAVAGSFGRLDAHPESDLDYMIVTEEDLATDQQRRMLDEIRDVGLSHQLKMPNPEGVFSQCVPLVTMLDTIGSREDSLTSLAQRMLLLMEAQPLYNEALFRNAVDRILRKFLELVISDSSKEALFLLNDTIRYFRTICVNYQFNFWREEEKWVIRCKISMLL